MSHSIKEVLSSKKAIAEALGIVAIGMTLLVTAGVAVAQYAILSTQTAQLNSVTAEVLNRAELYASELNSDLLHPEVPPTDRQCSKTPAMCTTILSVTPSDDGTKTVLRIQGDTYAALGQSVTKDVTLASSEVTHVTNIDADGNKVWALSNEGLRYKTWSVADGRPSDVDPDDMKGPTGGTKWVSVDDRAGVDSTGALWVWGLNDIGQGGIGTTSSFVLRPTKVSDETTSFRTVVTSADRAYAIDSKGNGWAWGKNNKGQLGLGTNTYVKTPTKIPGMRFVSFTIGKDNVFGITASGDLVTVGASQAGLPANTGLDWQTITPGTHYRAVAASPSGAVAMIDSTGILTMAGNSYPFTPASARFVSVSLGATTGYAISEAGTLYMWGDGPDGQLGSGTTTSWTKPTSIKANIVKVIAGPSYVLMIDVYGILYYTGKLPAMYTGGPDVPAVSTITKLMPGTTFSGIAADSGDTAAALVDTAGNLYSVGTTAAGLWPMSYHGAGDQPIRMPVPDGFSSYTWK
jgi:hypothetical protein